MTFSALVREERLARAARLLRAPEFRALTVTEIALRVGFCDAAHFSRCFRQRYGRSPLQFRTGPLG
jgi:AraC-like DNA-binding protein